MKGIFISIEGMDGSGKTTQIQKLREYFEKEGRKVILTREPGGTRISEDIRETILDIRNQEMGDITEALLYAASRAQHVHELIKPALEEGDIVICDRFVDSSIVYQGYARGLGEDMIRTINNYAIQGIMPDITFFLDIDHASGMERKKNQQELDRLEAEKERFHQLVREGYHRLVEKEGNRIVSIDASRSIEAIHEDLIQALLTKIEK